VLPPPAIVKLQPSDYSPRFDVVSGKLSQDLGIKVALLSPQGEIKTMPVAQPQFGFLGGIQIPQSKAQMGSEGFPSQMRLNLQKSIEGIALQKGYNVVSAYESIDLMSYEDKKRIDMLIIPELQLGEDESTIGVNYEMPKSMSMVTIQKGKINYSGKYSLKGQLIFQIIEPLTREKLFIKSIPYTPDPADVETIVEFNGQEQYAQASQLAHQSVQNAIRNARSQVLENAYKKLIDIIKTHLPGGEEAVNLAKQARELKAKAIKAW
jgi:hypothetical protein